MERDGYGFRVILIPRYPLKEYLSLAIS